MSNLRLDGAGQIVCPNTGYLIDAESVLKSMMYRKPIYSPSGRITNPPAHVLLTDSNGNEEAAIENDYGNNWVMGIAGEEGGGGVELGAVIGKRTFGVEGMYVRWGIFIPDRHRHLLDNGHFMDWVVRLGLDLFGMNNERYPKREMSKVLRDTCDNMQWLYANFSRYMNPEDKAVVGSSNMVLEDGTKFTEQRLQNGRRVDVEGWNR